ncbi:hypothetical protein PPERSA_00307 [Pseudocohnilembus persalinus]|uniref:Choline transporter-like protein n=1 Tax=Pseudocohnilembus persalinus TaxID=266149 RepID=A0A0V0Q9A9_PSEPJ|nr:hypothetical protein PPERSA_00307 [Pseudocohnilembus persalinus]|eukprot:KRW98719.1 hypothetical protein PPERSA_00307 [Pseudocohnilembus persalinus]
MNNQIQNINSSNQIQQQSIFHNHSSNSKHLAAKYQTGPDLTIDRKQTNFYCLLAFSIFSIICLIIAFFAFTKGNPSYLAQPFDPDHRPCGVGELKQYPYIYFVSPVENTLYRTVCVKTCPKTTESDNQGILDCAPNSEVTSCQSNLSPGDANQRVLYYDTTPFSGRVCLPTVSEYFTQVNLAMSANTVSQAWSDLNHTWMIICFSGIFALCLGYAIIYMLKISPQFAKFASVNVINTTPYIIYLPIVFFAVIYFYFLYWVSIATNLYSCGTVSQEPKTLPFGQFDFDSSIRSFAFMHIISLIWNSTFFIGACQFIILGSATLYYFQRKNPDILIPIKLLFKHHIGTVAYGAVIIALFDFIRIICEFIVNQVEEHADSQNKIVQMICTMVLKSFGCLEKVLQNIRKNSYIFTVLKGSEYRTATKELNEMLERRLEEVDKDPELLENPGFGEIFEFISTLTIMLFSTTFCFLIITHTDYYRSQLYSPVCPTICFAILTYVVGNSVMSLVGTTADGLIILDFMDEDMQKGQDYEGYEDFGPQYRLTDRNFQLDSKSHEMSEILNAVMNLKEEVASIKNDKSKQKNQTKTVVI